MNTIPIVPRVKPGTPATRSSRHWHPLRMAIHWLCFGIFLVLPFFNVMRFDIPRQRFYFIGSELWISEFAIIFLTLMFLMFLIGAAALFYGRVYCAYLCPQMIFSEASMALEKRVRRFVNTRRSPWIRRHKSAAVRTLFLTAMLPGAMFLAFIFVAYFVEPRDLWHRLAALDVSTAGGIAGAATTLLAFLDFAFLRLRFCTSVCPYGYLQGFISDDKTLLVAYQDPGEECVECKKCLRVCPMDIDVRASAHQIQCIHCGECIDACQDVMVRVGKPGLVHYAWGNLAVRNAAPWYRGFVRMDAKRFLVTLVVLAYASALWVALSKRSAVLVRVAPDRATLYALSADGMVTNHFRVSVANRGREAAQVALRVEGLPAARLSLPANALTVAAGEAVTQEFDVSMYSAAPGVAKFQFVADWTPKGGRREFPMTFIAPEKGSSR